MSDDEVRVRIVVVDPPKGVAFAVQRGRVEIVPPAHRTADALTFDFTVRATLTAGRQPPRLLGPFVQGPPAGRFVYITSGVRAGQTDSCWDRRAKVPLGGITSALIEAARAKPGATIEGRIAGRGRDGSPACASVPLLDPGRRIVSP